MSKSNRIKIDGEALRRELEKRNLSMTDVSKELGFAKSYISKVINLNLCNVPTMKLLEVTYNIKPENYEYKEPEPETEPISIEELETEEIVSQIDYKEFYKTIYGAVYHAMQDVLNNKEEEIFS